MEFSLRVFFYDIKKHQYVNLRIRQPFTRLSKFVKRGAGHHGDQAGEDLDTADVAPFAFGDGVEPDDLSGLALGLLQGSHGAGLVDGLGVGEDQQGGRRTQGGGLCGAKMGEGGSEIRALAVDVLLPDIVAEQIHVLKGKGIGLRHGFGEEEHAAAVTGLIQALDEPQGELGKLHHRARHIAQEHQMLLPLALALEFQVVQAAAGL